MHVLPLPFGMALAVIPRRDADKLRRPKPPILVNRERSIRDRVLSDIRYVDSRLHVL